MNCTTIVAGCVVLALAGTASAQDRASLKWPLLALATAGSADIVSTLAVDRAASRLAQNHAWGQSRWEFAQENNPLIGWIGPKAGAPVMVAAGAAAEAGLIWVACKLLCQHHPKVIKYAVIAMAGAHGTAASLNVSAARYWDRQRVALERR